MRGIICALRPQFATIVHHLRRFRGISLHAQNMKPMLRAGTCCRLSRSSAAGVLGLFWMPGTVGSQARNRMRVKSLRLPFLASAKAVFAGTKIAAEGMGKENG